MSALAIRPFNTSGYEILDGGIGRGEVVIWSVAPLRPRIGDEMLIESGGRPYDVAIDEIRSLKGGGWSAKGRARPA
jgi:hypothetical protein